MGGQECLLYKEPVKKKTYFERIKTEVNEGIV